MQLIFSYYQKFILTYPNQQAIINKKGVGNLLYSTLISGLRNTHTIDRIQQHPTPDYYNSPLSQGWNYLMRLLLTKSSQCFKSCEVLRLEDKINNTLKKFKKNQSATNSLAQFDTMQRYKTFQISTNYSIIYFYISSFYCTSP